MNTPFLPYNPRLKLELLKQDLRNERRVNRAAQDMMNALNNWMDGIMQTVLPLTLYEESKDPENMGKVNEFLKREGYHLRQMDKEGFEYQMWHKDQMMSEFKFKRPGEPDKWDFGNASVAPKPPAIN